MSLKRMNADERASYFLGQAVLRQLEHAPRDPDTIREIDAISRWIEHWLTDDEYHHVLTTTGYSFAGEFADLDSPHRSTSVMGGEDDDLPF
jgi:hypothetical protein